MAVTGSEERVRFRVFAERFVLARAPYFNPAHVAKEAHAAAMDARVAFRTIRKLATGIGDNPSQIEQYREEAERAKNRQLRQMHDMRAEQKYRQALADQQRKQPSVNKFLQEFLK